MIGRVAVTGSIATDHLMTFPGRFADSLVADRLDEVSWSFLVDELTVRWGGGEHRVRTGVAGPATGAGGAVGADFEDYRARLEVHRIDTKSVRVSGTRYTARFLCTTDRAQNQIASFYAGAMVAAREIELRTVADRVGVPGLVVIGPKDPGPCCGMRTNAGNGDIRSRLTFPSNWPS